MKKNIRTFLVSILFAITPFIANAHTGEHDHQGKQWHLMNGSQTIEANYISFTNELVYLRDVKSNAILQFPITDFSMEEQLEIDYSTLIGYFDEVTIIDQVELEYIATSL